MHLLGAETEPAHLIEDLIGSLGPSKGPVVLVVGIDIREDRRPELRDAGVRSAPECLLGEESEESLDHIQHDPYVGVK